MHIHFIKIAAIFFLGVLVGFAPLLMHELRHGVKIERHPHDSRQKDDEGYIFINPLLECKEAENLSSEAGVGSLDSEIQGFIDSKTKSGVVTTVSVYYRDLNAGPWFGINESKKFYPASMLKVPLAMSFYSKAEDDPRILSQKVVYVQDPNMEREVQPFPAKSNIVDHTSYSVQELISIMLRESSNEAAETLANLAGPEQIKSTYSELSLTPPVFGADYEIDVHTYAAFFRILFNATYLNKKYSEEVLQNLSKASFTDGLVAGVPSYITVAHKFGSRQVDTAKQVYQLHDCGIIYIPDHPYLLCVMTQGRDFTELARVIKDISVKVYTYVSSLKT